MCDVLVIARAGGETASRLRCRLLEETSHELRLPLSVLVTIAEVLLAAPRPSLEPYRQGLERSRRSAVRLEQTLAELLVAARGRARTIDRQPADLVRLAGAVVADAGVLAAARGITLSMTGPDRAVFPIDETTVARAVSNLVDNAIRYAPVGTTVTVAVELTGTHVVVVVTDRGPGIPAAEQARVFERFWRGQPETPGTGLGLPIARQVAPAHGGQLTLESPGPAGDGCVFRLSLRR